MLVKYVGAYENCVKSQESRVKKSKKHDIVSEADLGTHREIHTHTRAHKIIEVNIIKAYSSKKKKS